MSLFANLAGTATGFLSGRLWQVAAIGLFAMMVASSSYLGYQWHAAAAARDTAVKEHGLTKQALKVCGEEKAAMSERIGGLNTAIKLQNDAVASASAKTAEAVVRYEAALEQANLYGDEVSKLKRKLASRPPSTNCGEAIKRQREVINELNALRKQQGEIQ